MSQVDVPYTSQRLRFVVEPALADEIHGGTTALRKGCHLGALAEQVTPGTTPERDAFLAWMKAASGIQTDRDFRSARALLELLYHTFSAHSVDMADLAIGAMTVLDGSTEDKLRTALQLVTTDDVITEGDLVRVLSGFLLGLYCLFAGNADEDSHAPDAIVELLTHSATKTVQGLLEQTPTLTLEHIWDWYLLVGATEAPYLKLLDMDRWNVTEQRSAMAPPPSSAGDGVLFGFVSDSHVLGIHEAHAVELEDLLMATRFPVLSPQTLYDTFLHHTLDGWLDELTFIESVNELTCMTCTNHVMDDDKFMGAVRSLFKQYLGGAHSKTTVDAFELAAGFSLFAHGSKSDKLAAGFHFFDTDDLGYLSKGQLWRFLRSVILTILGLAPPAMPLPTSSILAFVDAGGAAILDALDAPTYTFETFGRWYNQGGFQLVSWLELLDLKKWTFVYGDFNTSILDKTPVQPVSASMYYTAKNIRATNQKEAGSNDTNPVHSGLLPLDSIPALCLKNDVVLAFDLLLESDMHPVQNLAFDNGDLLHYAQLQRNTGLYALDVPSVHNTFANYIDVHNGLATIDKGRFDACMAALLPEARDLSPLAALFFAFNRTGTGTLDATEFVSGFLLLCGGSKSTKLAFCFGLFDEDGDGFLTRREMWKFLRSFLTMLLALGNGADLSADTIGYICDAACISIAKSIFNESMSGDDLVLRSKVAFAEFADWYSEKGYALIPWIELLDAKKWPIVDATIADAVDSFTASTAAGQEKEEALVQTTTTVVSSTGGYPTTATTHDGYKDSSSVVFQFKLTSYDATMLRIRLRDVAVVSTIADKLRLRFLTCEALYTSLDKFAKGKCLTKSGFLYAIRSLAPKEGLSSEDQEFLSYHLLRLFSLYETETNLDGSEDDDHHDDAATSMPSTSIMGSAVDKLHLLSGLSILCAGSKSNKLGVLFTLYDVHRDGCISRRALFELFKSILALLFSFSLAEAASSSSNLFAAERAAGALTSQVFCETQSRSSISLGVFAEWYSAGGYQCCPWLELLDLGKWPTKAAMDAHAREKPLAYAFDMHEEGSLLQYSEKDIDMYLRMLDATQFPSLPVAAIHEAIVANARAHHGTTADGLVISRASFYRCIRKLIPRQAINEEGQHLASRLLARLFGVYDRKKTGKVQALELACGLTILGHGSKSQKLAAAFDLLVSLANKGSPHQTKLPHGMLFLYLRSILLALMVLSDARYRSGLEHMYVEADEVVGDATTKVLSEITLDASLRTRNRISFEQFGEWYNGGGYETLSWVELLDVAKWQHETTTTTTRGVRASDIGLAPASAPSDPVLLEMRLPRRPLRFTASSIHGLRECLVHLELHLYAPLQLVTVLKSFLKRHEAPSTDLLSPTVQVALTKDQFRSALLQLCATHAHCTNSYVLRFADAVFAAFAKGHETDARMIRRRDTTVPLVHLLCGLMVFTDGSLLEILLHGTALLCFTAFTEQLVDDVSAHHFVPRAILQLCLENFLKMLYATSSSILLDVDDGDDGSATAGAKACVSGFAPGGPDEMVAIEAFCSWYLERNEHDWLRLVVLENWPPELLELNLANRASQATS
ncbi:hypothetical protein SPRG_07136 [Saprolegnia parasitica CBS 223.65]|uniref:EF-hand domain-containing protein n=1 Tax=Saprolegnia parasitica (strain CBS 223.65) TaxID=695850 RepID=A0A067CBJ2_SAPPC|nr:hypothetical protein SPRG_07136 [Saprolegnia parasitica CBS 223.65]KDO27863.1 hypothetical protein SPRG_07136 [Saprolegnia parasitica CBS 223.65]|eukprot:XP_012201323.1 hypothetical protein SPRG_07136 [Saprolegnia parasitica CBS 223.65]